MFTPIPPWVPVIPPGFVLTHLSCAPCGVRVSVNGAGWSKFVFDHASHIKAFIESKRVSRPTWRSNGR